MSSLGKDLDKIHDKKSEDDLTTKTVQFHVDQGRSTEYDFDRLPIPSQESKFSEIRDFLGRPVLAGTYTWTTTSVQGDNIFNLYPSDLLTSNTMYVNKLLGFRYMRAKVHIKVEVQPTPFQYGAFYLAWLPFQKADAADRVKMHSKLMSYSQLPGVMYTTEDNSVELCTPYIGPQDSWDKTDPGSWDFGSFSAKIYCQLFAGTDNSNLTTNVYMWFTDVELSGLVAQGSSRVVAKRNPKNSIPAENELNDGQGSVTALFMKGAELADTAMNIPLFRTVAEPASWVLGSLAKVTSSFGWSKPDVGSGGKQRFVTSFTDAYATNHTGTDAGVYLTAEPAAYVTPHRMLSPRSEDEMSIDFVKQQWSYLTSFSFNVSQTQGQEIWSQYVCPQFLKSAINYETLGGTLPVYDMTPIAWLGHAFNTWRGPMRFRFLLLKTGFHSGQVQMSFTPTNSTVSFSEDQYLPRDIIDIQKGTSFCVDAPYVLNNPFINCNNGSGYLSMKVVNPLRAPATVNSAIVILVFVRGLEDTHFGKPDIVCPMPCWQPQGQDVMEEGDICSDGVIGNGVIRQPSKLIHQYTLGQKFNSLLQLCKMFTPVLGNQVSSYPSIPTTNDYAYFDPHYMGATAIIGVSAPYGVSMSWINGDYLARIAGLYLFHRGGIKIKIKNTRQARITSFIVPFNSSSSPDWRLDGISGFPTQNIRSRVTSDGLTSLITVLPQYSQYYGYPKQHYQDGGTIGDFFTGQTIIGIGTNTNFTWSEVDGMTIHRAAADDFSFHFFLGIPSCILGPNA